MFPKSKILMLVIAVGYGVLFSMALTGGVRIACWLLETELPAHAAGNLFLGGSLIAGAISAYVYSRQAGRVTPQGPQSSSILDRHFLV